MVEGAWVGQSADDDDPLPMLWPTKRPTARPRDAQTNTTRISPRAHATFEPQLAFGCGGSLALRWPTLRCKKNITST